MHFRYNHDQFVSNETDLNRSVAGQRSKSGELVTFGLLGGERPRGKNQFLVNHMTNFK